MTDLSTLISGDQDFWLAELPNYQRHSISEMLRSRKTYEQVAASWLNSSIADGTAPFGTSATRGLFFEKVVDELHDFLCVGISYENERSQIISGFKTGQAGLVATITAAISPHLDSAPSFLAPAVAVLLCAISKIGLGAWCRVQTERRAQETNQQLTVTDETSSTGDQSPQ
ncbi:hypothetical protein ACFYVE_06145 [Streptomyces tendae]|uniref:hypothetical protein n=1 Tax=Streptomyces tendae TaxID=1932 RepID=UPI0036B4BB3F